LEEESKPCITTKKGNRVGRPGIDEKRKNLILFFQPHETYIYIYKQREKWRDG
jgi:hypothetical protein